MLVPMSRIDTIFQRLRGEDRRALMPFVTAGDPDLATTAKLLPALERAGASVVELGIPFSDPIADGPVIQDSMSYALDHGVRVGKVLQTIAEVRPHVSLGLVAMVSYSIVYRLGAARFVQDAADAGIDGFIFPDLPVEESQDIAGRVHSAGLSMSMLIAPTTPIERAEQIAKASSGFVYVVSRAGITGESAALPSGLPERVDRLRAATDLPVAVGFGISSGEQVREVVRVADAAIVGSAIVRRIADHRAEGGDAVVRHVEQFTSELATGLGAQKSEVSGQ